MAKSIRGQENCVLSLCFQRRRAGKNNMASARALEALGTQYKLPEYFDSGNVEEARRVGRGNRSEEKKPREYCTVYYYIY